MTSNTLVILAGTSVYHPKMNLEDVEQARNNISALHELFVSGELLKVNSLDIFELLDRDISYLLETLEKLKTRPYQNFIFYYCGHGVIRYGLDSLCLPLTNSQDVDASQTGLIFKNIAGLLKSFIAPKKLFILDSCYSELAMKGFLNDTQSIDIKTLNQASEKGILTITSSARSFESTRFHPDNAQHTLFTEELIRALKLSSEEDSAFLDVKQLFDTLSANIARLNGPEPKITANVSSFNLEKNLALNKRFGRHRFDLLAGDLDPDFKHRITESISGTEEKMIMVGWGLAFVAAQNHELTAHIKTQLEHKPNLKTWFLMTNPDEVSLKKRVQDEDEAQPDVGVLTNWPVAFYDFLVREFNKYPNAYLGRLNYLSPSMVLEFDKEFYLRPYGPPNQGGKDCPWIILQKENTPPPMLNYLENTINYALENYQK